MADLYVMCGCPGAGKSTFIQKYLNKENMVIVSRDEIRFSLLQPNEDYFSHEGEVLNKLWEKTNTALSQGKNVVVDQTSLTPKSRRWLLSHIHGYDTVKLIWIDEDIFTCLERNEKRKGTKSYVPRGKIRRMHEQFVEPTLDEGFNTIFKYNSKKGWVVLDELVLIRFTPES